ncbi:uncharacterized protein KRP23_3020 [Phytophthora ramorum]|uniref:uncharacterized protein n=1 Tax=Phytophthora ramorum TaxID=164328 RepID=UPI0030B09EC1|nr:hypothetical protein KRP23_3020 [Phytophthora ramorum]
MARLLLRAASPRRSLQLLVSDVGFEEYSVASSGEQAPTNEAIRDAQRMSEAGTFCVDGKKILCPAGRYGEKPGETSPLCTGLCTRGFYCPEGSTSPTQRVVDAFSTEKGYYVKYDDGEEQWELDAGEHSIRFLTEPDSARVSVREERTTMKVRCCCAASFCGWVRNHAMDASREAALTAFQTLAPLDRPTLSTEDMKGRLEGSEILPSDGTSEQQRFSFIQFVQAFECLFKS